MVFAVTFHSAASHKGAICYTSDNPISSRIRTKQQHNRGRILGDRGFWRASRLSVLGTDPNASEVVT
jgi:hypothetical protein